MATIIVLFNLKNGVTTGEYEEWARETDLPTVRGLKAIDSFDVYKATGLLIGDDEPPYKYIEIIQVNDMNTFGQEISTDTMQKVANEFQGRLADNPCFIMCESLS